MAALASSLSCVTAVRGRAVGRAPPARASAAPRRAGLVVTNMGPG